MAIIPLAGYMRLKQIIGDFKSVHRLRENSTFDISYFLGGLPITACCLASLTG